MFEKKRFHWILAKAIRELVAEGDIKATSLPLQKGTTVKFLFSPRHRYWRRQASRSLAVIREYASPVIAGACGEQADMLFFNALTNRGFVSHGQDINEYGGKKWIASGRNLDFIISRDGFAYGCEVKNTWEYIDRDELETKIKICEYLGVSPLFIMRYSPKSYNDIIIRKGGFALLFVAQIYPFGQGDLVRRIKDTLGLEADCPRAIPIRIIDRFVRWHERRASVNR